MIVGTLWVCEPINVIMYECICGSDPKTHIYKIVKDFNNKDEHKITKLSIKQENVPIHK